MSTICIICSGYTCGKIGLGAHCTLVHGIVALAGYPCRSCVRRFNVAGAVLWTVLFVGAGFFFGNLPFVQVRAAARIACLRAHFCHAAAPWLEACVPVVLPDCTACADSHACPTSPRLVCAAQLHPGGPGHRPGQRIADCRGDRVRPTRGS